MAVREYYSHKKADEKKRQRGNQAAARQLLRNSRSNAQQLRKLDAGNGAGGSAYVAAKERARLGDVK
jgi:hypothetical protein